MIDPIQLCIHSRAKPAHIAIPIIEKCIELAPDLMFLKLELAERIPNQEAIDMLLTFKPTTSNDAARIHCMLGQRYAALNDYDRSLAAYKRALSFTDASRATSAIKLDMSHVYQLKYDAESCASILSSRALLKHYEIVKHYTLQPRYYSHKPTTSPTLRRKREAPITIAYMSPDFNRNAVGLFVKPLLFNYDKSRFRVVVLYTRNASDWVTEYFKTADVEWIDVADEQSYRHLNIDILIELIGHGMQNRLDLVRNRPARTCITYLGYPDYTCVPEIEYRLVDVKSDPDHFDAPSVPHETPLKMQRSFMCFQMFPDIFAAINPIVAQQPRIGLFNRQLKLHSTYLDALDRIKDRVVLVVKLGFNEQPHPRLLGYPNIEFLEFALVDGTRALQRSLERYLEYFNLVDVCADPWPYSGTATTCSALYMGVPTICKRGTSHVSNVSASINDHLGLQQYNVDDIDQYLDALLNIKHRGKEERIKLKNRFTAYMDPDEFMREYESIILKV